MKVIVSCAGKFHAFYLAEQLDKRGYLHKLLTFYSSKKKSFLPTFREDVENINQDKVITNIFPYLVNGLLNKIPLLKNFDINYFSNELFDKWAQNQIDMCDILVVWSNAALSSLKKAKSCEITTILERGSTHILYQKQILEEEYDKYNLKIKPVTDQYLKDELFMYRETDYISIPSTFAKQTYIEKGIDASKLIQIPYGVNLNVFKQVPKEDNVFRVVFAGGLTLRKGVHYLLEAFSSLKLKNAELLLIGACSSEITSFLKRYEGSYKYIGIVPHLHLYKYLSSGSVFVLPSIEEGLAMVIPQAMACGLPVICTTNSGGADIIRNNVDGYIVPIRNVNALEEKLLYLYQNQDVCKEMGNSALNQIKNNFTWDHYGEKIISRYRNILS